jgi:hypothetical protein
MVCTWGAYKDSNFFSLAKEAGRVPLMLAKLFVLRGARECDETRVVQDGHNPRCKSCAIVVGSIQPAPTAQAVLLWLACSQQASPNGAHRKASIHM